MAVLNSTLVAVAVPVPFLGELTYSVPAGMNVPAVGARVRVPVGSRVVTGCVVGHDAAPIDSDPKPIQGVVDDEPYLPPAIVDLCRWTAEYYMAGIGDALRMAMPPGARHQRSTFKTERVVSITAHGLGALTATTEVEPANGHTQRLTAKQRTVLQLLEGAPGGVRMAALRESGVTGEGVRRLLSRGLVAVRETTQERDPFEARHGLDVRADPSRVLTLEQDRAVAKLSSLAKSAQFAVALLHGVTGSGKTEVYLRLADAVLRSGRQVLLLVPEIALTPAVATLFRSAFGSKVAIQHSGLSDGERHDQWHRIRRGDVDVVVGTRSAVFAPLSRPGLIIVDEEHDASYKQEEAPRYHARDVAIVRGQAAHALVLLGSATPSMESYHNATTGKYVLISLEKRILDRPLASVRLINMRDEYAEQGPDVVISQALDEAIRQRLLAQQQVVVLLNRRGYATAVFCRQCGDTFDCPNCSVSLTMHTSRKGEPVGGHRGAAHARVAGWGRCHYCDYSLRIPPACRKCAAPYLEQAGFGTEKVEAQLRERFPEARIARVDRDTVRRKGVLAGLLGQFSRGELDILVGTQMLAKGHDFPRVTLVGVISADVGLGLADFRAGERTFQLLTQVAGRAGRGDQLGEAIIQTLYPEHYSVDLAWRQDYVSFFGREIEFRRGMKYPPAVAMVNVIARGRTFEQAMDLASEFAAATRAQSAHNLIVLGPAPAPIERLRGEHRVQIFLKGTRRADMRQVLTNALQQLPDARRRLTIDVDPLSVL